MVFKSIFLALIFAVAAFGSGSPEKQVVAPGPFRQCKTADFSNADSAAATTYKGKYCPAKGIRVRPGCTDTGFIAYRPINAVAPDTIYLKKIGPLDIGYELPCNFGLIYRYKGTTYPVDSIEYFPDFP
jgi:hypothetical protein